jgi:isocitrate dehydrogenase
VRTPEHFEVIVTSNMNGDILSDLTSGLIGGLGFAPGANLGDEVAIFEAVHGSAPKYAGKNVINPSAVLLSATMMLRHLDEFEIADAVESAVMVTYESGIYLQDVSKQGSVSTTAFTDAVVANLGQRSERWGTREHKPLRIRPLDTRRDYVRPAKRDWIGVDIFVESPVAPEVLGPSLETLVEGSPLRLKMISNRGTKVYPATGGMTDCVDHWRCRFVRRDGAPALDDAALLGVLRRIGAEHRWMHVEKLEEHDGALAYTRAQGED